MRAACWCTSINMVPAKYWYGLFCWACWPLFIWRLYETVADPYCYGNRWKGLVKRGAIALSSLADALIAYSAVQALWGLGNLKKTGQPVQERNTVQNVLEWSWGSTLLCALGFIILFTAIVQFGYVINKTYRERLNVDHLQKWKPLAIETLPGLGILPAASYWALWVSFW